MSEPLKYKAELAVSRFIEVGALSALNGWSYYRGQNPGAQTPPCVVVSALSQVESFPNAKPKNVQLTVEIVSSMDADQDADNIHGDATDRATNWSAHRDAVQAVEARLENLTALQAFANKTNVNNRPVSAFYVYDIQENNQQSAMSGEDRMLVSVIGITLVCEAQDN